MLRDLDLICASASGLRERLAAAASADARVAALEDWLIRLDVRQPPREVVGVVGIILRSNGRASIGALSSMTGLGRRRMERCFTTRWG